MGSCLQSLYRTARSIFIKLRNTRNTKASIRLTRKDLGMMYKIIIRDNSMDAVRTKFKLENFFLYCFGYSIKNEVNGLRPSLLEKDFDWEVPDGECG